MGHTCRLVLASADTHVLGLLARPPDGLCSGALCCLLGFLGLCGSGLLLCGDFGLFLRLHGSFSSSFLLGGQSLVPDQVLSSDLCHVVLPGLHLVLVADFVVLCQLRVNLRCGTNARFS